MQLMLRISDRPPDTGNAQILELMKMQVEAANRQADAADRRAAESEKRYAESVAKFNPLESLNVVAGVVSKFQEISGGAAGAGGDRPWWQELLVDAGPDVLRNLAPGIGAMLNGMRMPAAANPAGAGATTQPSPTQTTSLPPAPPPAAQDPYIPSYRNLLMVIDSLFSYIDRGLTGIEWADSVADLNGDTYVETIKGAGRERLIAALKTIPELLPRIQPIEARFSQFLDEVMAWPADDGDDEVDPPPPGAKPSKKKKGVN